MVGSLSPLRVGIVVIVLAAALIGWEMTPSPSPSYRTSVVGTGTVVATLDSVGTIAPVNQADLNFNLSGTIGALDVSVGQTVSAGQTLASLDVGTLNATVVSAEATLASAKVSLASAEATETASAPVPAPAATTTTNPPSSSPTPASQSDQQVTQLQATLVADQTQEDADSSQAGASLQQANASCGSVGATTSTTTSTTTTTTSSSGTAPSCAGRTEWGHRGPGLRGRRHQEGLPRRERTHLGAPVIDHRQGQLDDGQFRPSASGAAASAVPGRGQEAPARHRQQGPVVRPPRRRRHSSWRWTRPPSTRPRPN